MNNHAATIQLTIDQIAAVLQQLSSHEIETLEELLDKKTTAEVLNRSEDPRDNFLSHDDMLKSFA